MLQRLYDKTMALAASRHATPALAGVSFAESSFFPIPPDLLLVPMVLSQRSKWIFYAALCTVASVVGGMAGYLIGSLLYETVAQPILAFYGYADKFADFTERFNRYGAWIVFLAGITPFPYKVITIASGATGLSLPVFLLASVLARGIRFFMVAGLLYVFGPPIRAFIEERLALVLALVGAAAVLGLIAVKLL
ncbi:YqaA family protein [Acuticoccus sp. I52.16.1]|uniref:YqaA family protein n=1 Tax=Acuticoccus sp. I52.16.1 TaxID=2928472 RepID=UPI001FD2582C|nr:YqaA family protein [Acuticoccus sp. I52.16.1]UOM33964.1 DedA family protein [Acuticoccus sp. I52.16.1]